MKRIVRLVCIVSILFLWTSVSRAEVTGLPVWHPKLGYTPDLSEQAQANWDKGAAIFKKLCSGELQEKNLTPEQKRLLECYSEGYRGIWDIMGEFCSWYCAGGPYEIRASSVLPPQGSHTYVARNAHDFDLRTAWVEGKKGYGIGEFIQYSFEPFSPRVNAIIIFNGYVRTAEVWENNSRVRRLKFYIDDKPHAIMELEDSRAQQLFSIPAMQSTINGRDMVFKFEIMDVYKGKKWDDVAVTEIYYDGLDVHCFRAGTMIKMADGSQKAVESLRPGQLVLGYDPQSKTFSASRIEGLARKLHHSLARLDFGSTCIVATEDHPFWIEGKGWCSLQPEKTLLYKNLGTISILSVGDKVTVLGSDGRAASLPLKSIELLAGAEETYTITKLGKSCAFFANGLLAGTEEL